MRGHPIKASSLSYEERGSLALETHTGSEWKDITEQEAIESQYLPFSDEEGKAEDGGDNVSEPSISPTFPALSASEEKKMIKVSELASNSASGIYASNNTSYSMLTNFFFCCPIGLSMA